MQQDGCYLVLSDCLNLASIRNLRGYSSYRGFIYHHRTLQEFLLFGGIWLCQLFDHFVRYGVGEGIEKRQDNFVEEVMNQAK